MTMKRLLSLSWALSILLGGMTLSLAAPKTPKALWGKIYLKKGSFMHYAKPEEYKKYLDSKNLTSFAQEQDGTWSFNLKAFFNITPNPGQISLSFFDATDAVSIQYNAPLHSEAFPLEPGQDDFQAEVVLEGEMGFAKGKKYIVKIIQIVGKKTNTLASTEITLN